MVILYIAAFVAIGVVIGFLGSRLFEGSSPVISILMGLVGSLGLSWLGSLFGLGGGFLSFTLWGLVIAILGACLLTGIYGFISKRMG